MVKSEIVGKYVHTYSDTRMYILRDDGKKFADAIDKTDRQHTYTETEESIPADEDR